MYKYLEDHPFVTPNKEEGHYHKYFVYKDPTNVGTGTIRVPNDEEGVFGWAWSEGEPPLWFQELAEKAKQEATVKFRLKKITRGIFDKEEQE